MLALGVLTRAILVPITHGPDFAVWDLASQATLRGVNVYAHHPPYGGGPYTYLPLFLDIELPFQWLAVHTGVPFTVLGKVPIVLADLATTLLMVRVLRRASAGRNAQALAAAAVFLNPLVLYNGAFYGRFDSVALALLMLAVSLWQGTRSPGWRGAVAFALAVAAKTYPLFLLPWSLRRGRHPAARLLVCVAAAVLVLSAPYLVSSPAALLTDLTYSATKLPGGLSWQVVLHGLPAAAQVDAGYALFGVFVVAALAAAFIDDLWLAGAVVLVLFLLLSKQVIEQYLLWPMPFLVLLGTRRGERAARLLVVELTAAGMTVNAYFHPFGVQPAAFNVGFAVVVAATLARLLATRASGNGTRHEEAQPMRRVRNPVAGAGR